MTAEQDRLTEARAGTPCLFAPQASLAELLPAEAAVLVPWSPGESAERAHPFEKADLIIAITCSEAPGTVNLKCRVRRIFFSSLAMLRLAPFRSLQPASIAGKPAPGGDLR